MTVPATKFRKATLQTALMVLQDAGLPICGAEITPDGTVRILTTPSHKPIEPENPFLKRRDELRKTQLHQKIQG